MHCRTLTKNNTTSESDLLRKYRMIRMTGAGVSVDLRGFYQPGRIVEQLEQIDREILPQLVGA